MDDFREAAAVDGTVWIRQRLLASHNIRMGAFSHLPPDYTAVCWIPLRYISFLYGGLRKAGLEQILEQENDATVEEGWVRHLHWGLDSVQQSVRLLLAGQITGAAVVARGQLERWTENRAHNLRLRRLEREPSEDYVLRVWQAKPNSFVVPGPSSKDTVEACGMPVAPREVVKNLHQIVHGELHNDVVEWANRGFDGSCQAASVAAGVIMDGLLLALEQLTICIRTLLLEKGKNADAIFVGVRPPIPLVAIAPLPASLWPVNALLIQEGAAESVYRLSRKFEGVCRGERPDDRLYNDAELILLCFTDYRARQIRHASRALMDESNFYGRDLTQDDLNGSEFPPVMVSEMAAALSTWISVEDCRRSAAATMSDALRGAYWLWLEDDNRSMAVLRVVLEQAARLRVWRIKPDTARKLESSGTPVKWLSKAGWRRLSSLNRALGEFSHYRPDVNWGGAFELLVLLNREATPNTENKTARRNALEIVVRLAAREICEAVLTLDIPVGQAFKQIAEDILAGGAEVDARIDAFLDVAHGYSSHDLSTGSQ